MKNKILVGSIASLFLFDNAISQPINVCGAAPMPTTTTLNYNPLSTSTTDITFSVPGLTNPAPDNNTNRYFWFHKQVKGSETEGVRYDIIPLASSKMSFVSTPITVTGYSYYFGTWRPDPWTSAYTRGSPLRGETVDGIIRFSIDSGQNISSNKTIEMLASTYWSGNNFGCPNYFGSIIPARRTFTINPVSVAAISMTGGGTTGTIDFNTANGLKTGEKKSVTINVKTNQKFKVTMDSTNNGYLNLNNAIGATEKIAYTATFDNMPINDSTVYNDTGNGTGGIDNPKTFEITIGNTDNARAGWYKDVVTLTISPF